MYWELARTVARSWQGKCVIRCWVSVYRGQCSLIIVTVCAFRVPENITISYYDGGVNLLAAVACVFSGRRPGCAAHGGRLLVQEHRRDRAKLRARCLHTCTESISSYMYITQLYAITNCYIVFFCKFRNTFC